MSSGCSPRDERITSTPKKIGQPTNLDVEERNVVVMSTVSVDHFDSTGPRVRVQVEKLCSMMDGVRGFKDGIR